MGKTLTFNTDPPGWGMTKQVTNRSIDLNVTYTAMRRKLREPTPGVTDVANRNPARRSRFARPALDWRMEPITF
jgi:hypothetical protein